jgi:hypothetical protein
MLEQAVHDFLVIVKTFLKNYRQNFLEDNGRIQICIDITRYLLSYIDPKPNSHTLEDILRACIKVDFF